VIVTFELIVLALATAIRPTSLAAVYALLSSSAPRRLMTLYVIAGIVFTLVVGLLVILALHGVQITSSSSQAKAIAEIIGGGVILVLGVLLLIGRIGRRLAGEEPKAPSRWAGMLQKRITPRTAALAGPATHIPGIFYLVALNLIASQRTQAPRRLFDLLLYNGVWFSLPIAALAICVFRPDAAANGIKAIEQWTRQHVREILTVISFVVGAALLGRGLLAV
jgi:hypothetical protein